MAAGPVVNFPPGVRRVITRLRYDADDSTSALTGRGTHARARATNESVSNQILLQMKTSPSTTAVAARPHFVKNGNELPR